VVVGRTCCLMTDGPKVARFSEIDKQLSLMEEGRRVRACMDLQRNNVGILILDTIYILCSRCWAVFLQSINKKTARYWIFRIARKENCT